MANSMNGLTAILCFILVNLLRLSFALSDSPPAPDLSFDFSSLTVRNVTIFNGDKAEVTRVLNINQAVDKGYHTIKVSGIPKNVDDSSIRLMSPKVVAILDMKTITTKTTVKSSAAYLEKTDQLKKQLRSLNTKRDEIISTKSLLESRKKVVTDIARRLHEAPITTKVTTTSAGITGASSSVDGEADGKAVTKEMVDVQARLQDTLRIIDFQAKEVQSIDSSLRELAVQLEEADQAIAKVNQELQDLSALEGNPSLVRSHSSGMQSIEAKELTFRILAEKDIPLHSASSSTSSVSSSTSTSTSTSMPSIVAEFLMTYTTTQANWEATYDIHIKERDPTDALPTTTISSAGASATAESEYIMEINYFAYVQQRTGEDWADAHVVLSTASPSDVSQQYPVPPSLEVCYPKPPPPNSFLNQQQRKQQKQKLVRHASRSKRGVVPEMMAAGMAMDMEDDETESVVMDSADAPMMFATSASPEIAVADRGMGGSATIAGGNLGASYQFHLKHPASLPSLPQNNFLSAYSSTYERKGRGDISAYSHMLLIEQIDVPVKMFTYAVPSFDGNASPHMMAWAKYPLDEMFPLLPTVSGFGYNGARSHDQSGWGRGGGVRLRVEGSELGRTSFPGVQPGERMEMHLGPDRKVVMETTRKRPSLKGKKVEHVTWFTRDTKKFHVRTETRYTTVRSVQKAGYALVIVVENLPKSVVDEEITVELLSPAVSDFTNPLLALQQEHKSRIEATAAAAAAAGEMGGSSQKADAFRASLLYTGELEGDIAAAAEQLVEEEFLSAVVESAYLAKPGKSSALRPNSAEKVGKDGKEDRMPPITQVFFNKMSGNIYWAVWLAPGESHTVPFEYRMLNPVASSSDEKKTDRYGNDLSIAVVQEHCQE